MKRDETMCSVVGSGGGREYTKVQLGVISFHCVLFLSLFSHFFGLLTAAKRIPFSAQLYYSKGWRWERNLKVAVTKIHLCIQENLRLCLLSCLMVCSSRSCSQVFNLNINRFHQSCKSRYTNMCTYILSHSICTKSSYHHHNHDYNK